MRLQDIYNKQALSSAAVSSGIYGVLTWAWLDASILLIAEAVIVAFIISLPGFMVLDLIYQANSSRRLQRRLRRSIETRDQK